MKSLVFIRMVPNKYIVLIHHSNIVDRMVLPTGRIINDVHESHRKDWKNIHHHMRKISRKKNTNRDKQTAYFIHEILSLRKIATNREKPFRNTGLQLLKARKKDKQ